MEVSQDFYEKLFHFVILLEYDVLVKIRSFPTVTMILKFGIEIAYE